MPVANPVVVSKRVRRLRIHMLYIEAKLSQADASGGGKQASRPRRRKCHIYPTWRSRTARVSRAYCKYSPATTRLLYSPPGLKSQCHPLRLHRASSLSASKPRASSVTTAYRLHLAPSNSTSGPTSYAGNKLGFCTQAISEGKARLPSINAANGRLSATPTVSVSALARCTRCSPSRM